MVRTLKQYLDTGLKENEALLFGRVSSIRRIRVQKRNNQKEEAQERVNGKVKGVVENHR